MNYARLTLSVLLPTGVYEIGTGAVTPVTVPMAAHLGASPAIAGLVLALMGVGRILGDVPASMLANRLGDRKTMLLASWVSVASTAPCFFLTQVWQLAACTIVGGVANAAFQLGRQAYLTEVTPPHQRARALSTLGGSHRIGLFIGPFAAAAVVSAFGLRWSFVLATAANLAALIILAAIPDMEEKAEHAGRPEERIPAGGQLSRHRRLFLTLGGGILLVGAVRAARQNVLPLWAAHIGLDAATTSVIFGVSSGMELLLFYPSGKVMDNWGRLAVAIPAMTLLGAGIMMLPLSGGALLMTVAACIIGFGNGVGSGIMMTLGADAAPPDGRVRFLGSWRLISDVGNAAGPLTVAFVAGFAPLAAGIELAGVAGLAAAIVLGIYVPRYSSYAFRRSSSVPWQTTQVKPVPVQAQHLGPGQKQQDQ